MGQYYSSLRFFSTNLEDFETRYVENTYEGCSLAFGSVKRSVYSGDKPLEHAFVDGFTDGFHGKLNLKHIQYNSLKAIQHEAMSTTKTILGSQSYQYKFSLKNKITNVRFCLFIMIISWNVT